MKKDFLLLMTGILHFFREEKRAVKPFTGRLRQERKCPVISNAVK